MDDGIDLTADERAQLSAMAQHAAARDHYALLNAKPTASAAELQQAFYQISRTWHPDRFFRRELGEYREVLDTVFLAVTESYRILSNPVSRLTYDRARPAAPSGAARTATADPSRPSPRPAPRLDRAVSKAMLEMRAQLKERLQKAATLHAEGVAARAEGQVLKASNAFSMALTYDPKNEQYKTDAEEAKKAARLHQARQAIAAAENAESFANHRQAHDGYRRAIEFGLREARAFYRLGVLTKKLDEDTKAAVQHLRQAVALDGDNLEYRLTLAEMYTEAGMATSARAQYEHILSVDKTNSKAKESLKELNRT